MGWWVGGLVGGPPRVGPPPPPQKVLSCQKEPCLCARKKGWGRGLGICGQRTIGVNRGSSLQKCLPGAGRRSRGRDPKAGAGPGGGNWNDRWEGLHQEERNLRGVPSGVHANTRLAHQQCECWLHRRQPRMSVSPQLRPPSPPSDSKSQVHA